MKPECMKNLGNWVPWLHKTPNTNHVRTNYYKNPLELPLMKKTWESHLDKNSATYKKVAYTAAKIIATLIVAIFDISLGNLYRFTIGNIQVWSNKHVPAKSPSWLRRQLTLKKIGLVTIGILALVGWWRVGWSTPFAMIKQIPIPSFSNKSIPAVEPSILSNNIPAVEPSILSNTYKWLGIAGLVAATATIVACIFRCTRGKSKSNSTVTG